MTDLLCLEDLDLPLAELSPELLEGDALGEEAAAPAGLQVEEEGGGGAQVLPAGGAVVEPLVLAADLPPLLALADEGLLVLLVEALPDPGQLPAHLVLGHPRVGGQHALPHRVHEQPGGGTAVITKVRSAHWNP